MNAPSLRVVPPSPAGVKPFLRWAGGKRWFVKEYGDDLFEHVCKRGGKYIEPFLGGASMALHLGLQGMVLGDVEDDLITLYTTVRDEPELLIAMLGLLADFGTSKRAYHHVRDLEPRTSIERAAKVVYLNRLCFNGLYRKNRSGGFNVPYGGKEKELPSAERILEVSKALAGSELHRADFGKLIERAGVHDTLYVDPPYDLTFGDYSSDGFPTAYQERLALQLQAARARGADIFAHNADTPLIRKLYHWATLIPMPERRAINSDGQKRGEASCVLIVSAENW